MSDCIRNTVICVKVFSPVEILACDQQIASEVDKLLDNTMKIQGHARPLRTAVNEMYAVVEKRVWKRVTLLEIIGGRDVELKVKYIDYGLQGLVTASKLLKLPKELKLIEPAAKRYLIPGLLPVSINTVCTSNINRPIQARQSISKNWSEAARSWFLRVKEDNDDKFEVCPLTSAKSQSPVLCEIFVRPDGLSPHRSLADLLVEQNFAVRRTRRSISPGASPPEERAEAAPVGPRENSPSGSSDDLSAPESRLMQCSAPAAGDATPDSEKLDLARMERAVFRMCPVRAPEPILSFNRSPLAVSIKRCLTRHHVGYLLFIQAHMTPIILRGMDVLAVAPPRKGKTTGLLMPLLTRICAMAEDPTTMPKGSGPFAIVVCHSWTKVRQCADYAEAFLKQSPSRLFHSLRVVAAYGGIKSDAKAELDVTVGCELLVTTPRLLVRLIEKRLIEFERLEALAMDGIDVMAEFYLEEMKKIVLARKRMTNQTQTHQVIATASSWTPAVTSFSKICMHNAVEVYAMGGVMEAAVRMKMPHFLLPCKDGISKLESLLSFLVEVDLSKDAVVICTKSGLDAANIYRFLQERFAWERVLLLGEEEQTDEQKHHVTACWNAQMRDGKRRPVLVAYDYQNAPPFNVSTASVLVHYDLAAKADALFRYHFLRAAMESYEPDRPLDVRCYYMFNQQRWAEAPVRGVTDQVVETVNFLHRVRPTLSEELLAISHNRKAALEIANGLSTLCHQLRYFGRCRMPGCRERHTVLAEVDRPLLPNSGEVEFQMINARSANHIYARLLSHRPDSQEEVTDYRQTFLALQTEINDYYLNPENQRILTMSEIQPGMLVAVHATSVGANHYQRARVVLVENRKHARKVKVVLLDEGRHLLLDPERLLELPSRLQELPGQAVELILSRFQPLDEDTEFTPETTDEAEKLLSGAVFFGRVSLCLGSTLWLHSVAQRVHHRATRTHVIDNDLRKVLIDKGLAVDNSEHIHRLVALCRGQVDVAKPGSPGRYLARRFTYQKKPLKFSQLNDEGLTTALCGDMQSPELFYIIRDDLYDELWNMSDEIAEHISSVRRFPSRAALPGQFAMCMWEKTKDWNRVLILDTVSGLDEEDEEEMELYSVRFVDFGDTDIVRRKYLRQLPDQFRELPATAIECSLANCQPASAEGWTPEIKEVLMDYFYDDHNCRLVLDAKTIVKRPAADGSRTHYVVDVVEREIDRNLSLHLIIEGLALGNVELAEQIFPHAKERISPLLRKRSPVHIAFDLLTCQDFRLRTDLCESLFQTVTNWPHLSPNIRRRYTGGDLCALLARLVRFCCPLLEIYFLYRALQAAMELQEAGEDFALQDDAADLMPHAVQHLQRLQQQRQDLSAEQRQRLLVAIARVLLRLTGEPQCCEAFLCVPRWASVLTTFLEPGKEHEEEEEATCCFLQLSLQLCAKANAEDVIALSKANLALMERLPPHSVCWEPALALLEQHSKLSGAVLRSLLSVDAMGLLWRQLAAQQSRQEPPAPLLLHSFVSAATELWLRGDQKRRVQFVKAEDRSVVLDWLVANCSSPKVGALVFDMRMEISRIQRTGSKALSALLHPKKQRSVVMKPRLSPVMITIGERCRPPHVTWFQGRKFLFLVIAVQKLNLMKTSPVIMSDNSVHFSALSQGETLAFDLPLCYPVDPHNSSVKITEFEVRVKIHKAQTGSFWAHVTPNRHTPAWLTQNMDHVGYQADEAPASMIEKAEDDSGFSLPCVKKAVHQHMSGYIARTRMRYRRRMERVGRHAVGKPPDIDTAEWMMKQGAEAFFPSRGGNSAAAAESEDEEAEAEEKEEEFEVESDDDSFYDESESDMEDLDVADDHTHNPAVEDCMDHYWHW